MLLLSTSQKYILIIVCLLVVFIALAIALTIILLKKKNKGHVKVDEEFLSNIIIWLGGKENIKECSVDNARLKVLVEDLDKVDANSLHTLSEKGVFITGNNVKLLFKYDSKLIQKEIEKRL